MLLDQVNRTIDFYHLLEKGDRVIVGVSGGIDSMVLLHVLNTYLQELDLSLVVAHVNHGLRPDESEREAELVQKESERLGVPFEYEKFDVKGFQQAAGLSLQDASRRIRFRFFKTLFQKYHAQKIALGHNADDQVETVLLRLMRGSGLKGLKGMLPIRDGRVIRPLLEVWRTEIESFAMAHSIPSLLDSSNLKKRYLRNRLRLTLIPLIEREYQSNFKAVITRTSTILREENDYLEREAQDIYQKIVREENETLSFRFSEYQSLHKAVQWRVLHKALDKIYSGEMMEEGEGREIGAIYRKLQKPSLSFLMELPHGIFIEKRYDKISLGKGRVKAVLPFEVELISPGRTLIEEIGREVLIEETTSRDIRFGSHDESRHIAFLDYKNLQFPLRMRNFRPGDRFQPMGMMGTQKLKKFFIDHKVPRYERLKIPLLISGEMIVWIVGYRISERVKVMEKTEKVLRIEVV
jgi:tRNA(Ile)-lysidine synthase